MRSLTNLVLSLSLAAGIAGCKRDYSFLGQRDAAGDTTNRYDAGADHQVASDVEGDRKGKYDLGRDMTQSVDLSLDARARDLGMDAPESDVRQIDGRVTDGTLPDRYLADRSTADAQLQPDVAGIDAPRPDTYSPDAGADRPVIIFPDVEIPDLYADSRADMLPDVGRDSPADFGADMPLDLGADVGADAFNPCPGEAPLNRLQAGVCAGSRNVCGAAGWQEDYSSVAGYEVNEVVIDGFDNDCDGVIDDTAWRQVTAGLFHTCAVRNEGSVQCWGSNSHGQRDTIPAGSFLSIDAGAYHNCGLKNDSTIACWGRNDEGQSDVPINSYIQLDTGYNFTCGLRSDNTVDCWGDNSNGQSSTEPPGRFTQVTAGISHGCAVREDSAVECWGNNADGRAPSSVAGNFFQVSAGNQHSCGLSPEGIECWGRIEQTASRPGLYLLISSDYDYNCSLDLGGIIACWGVGEGVGGMSSPAGNFIQLDVGVYHSCAISLEGLIDCWGREDYGPP